MIEGKDAPAIDAIIEELKVAAGEAAARTREVDEQKHFVEVVLEALPLGLFVLDGDFRVVRANREGAALLPFESGGRRAFVKLLPPAKAPRIREFLTGKVARWWLPDEVVFVDELPHTATGKIKKSELRERFRDHVLPTA